jgi:hypothetical protein
VFVVWDPVLSSVRTPPAGKVLDLLTDQRIRQLWDPDHRMSSAMRGVVDAAGAPISQARLRTEESESGILYDTIVLFSPGPRWAARLPAPVYMDGGFEAKKAELQQRLRALAAAPR